jgi:hypothetical protein
LKGRGFSRADMTVLISGFSLCGNSSFCYAKTGLPERLKPPEMQLLRGA